MTLRGRSKIQYFGSTILSEIMHKLSVIICTYNPRDEYLSRTLEALRKQTVPLEQWKLFVIDNASNPFLTDRFDVSWHPFGKITREEKLGKMNAWFKGINETEEDLLVFVDDDNVLAPDYLEQVLAIADQWPALGAWGASVLPEYESPLPSWIKGLTWRLSIEEVKADVWSNLREGFEAKPLGAGMCVRRKVAVRYLEWCRANEINNVLDRKGDVITGYGDMNLALCAIDLGLGTGKFARLRLTHLIPSSRLTLNYLTRHAEGDAASLMVYRALRGLPVEKPKNSLLSNISRRLHRLRSSKPKEYFTVEDAHLRGLVRGWQMIQEYNIGQR
jgi:Glycosyl transferase family 2